MSQKYPEWYELPARRWKTKPDLLFENERRVRNWEFQTKF